ncbi:organelle RRM domain-containing protein 2, mitochondrial [Nymphaea colorata]|nr:organelle RRM domain-containing protein 2, mitochondrial [Nymphaea colorata]
MAFSASLRRVLCRSSSSSTPLTFAPLSSPVRFNSSLVSKTKLFVSGLSRLTTDEKLREAFSPFGQLLEAKVITDRASGRSKGFGFVRYATEEEATNAREGMNAKFLDGWVIFVDPAKPREPRPPPPPEPNPSEAGFRINKTIGWCG